MIPNSQHASAPCQPHDRQLSVSVVNKCSSDMLDVMRGSSLDGAKEARKRAKQKARDMRARVFKTQAERTSGLNVTNDGLGRSKARRAQRRASADIYGYCFGSPGRENECTRLAPKNSKRRIRSLCNAASCDFEGLTIGFDSCLSDTSSITSCDSSTTGSVGSIGSFEESKAAVLTMKQLCQPLIDSRWLATRKSPCDSTASESSHSSGSPRKPHRRLSFPGKDVESNHFWECAC